MKQNTTIVAAITLPHHKVPGSGGAFMIEASTEEEQYTLMQDIAKALKADVVKLSNGIFILIG
ncbi:capping complex subunit for YIEGIA [Sporomusa acidovorans]|uniref:capping complex subunit for YIEGIA n=1 Tax=Sporomusa acidovorans TaxID=112900 RepID=UPI000888EB89|nr:hypothetical protein [Sporomusa acidovorans]OZC19121.1 hypothetical protein SPACI_32070 [Sporomusa acidovorans DSM 3132]SDD67902.1 hypothetical protein SAMN04488499_100367 [Sporomusa acidovorans]